MFSVCYLANLSSYRLLAGFRLSQSLIHIGLVSHFPPTGRKQETRSNLFTYLEIVPLEAFPFARLVIQTLPSKIIAGRDILFA